MSSKLFCLRLAIQPNTCKAVIRNGTVSSIVVIDLKKKVAVFKRF